MKILNHVVRKESFLVSCDTLDCALTLRPLLSELNLSRLLPIIEQVLNEVAPAGRHVTIGRLEVDLGEIGLDDFEDVVAGRLYEELRTALERAMAHPFGYRETSEMSSRIALIEWYLLRGSLPSLTAGRGFSLGEWFAEIASEDREELARLVRRVGRYDYALRRIVRQLSEAQLQELVEVLAPEHADLILSYVADVIEIDREEPITPLPESAFEELLWMLVLTYLVNDAGSEFNRKAFVQSVVQGFATKEGLSYEAVLAEVGRGLQRTVVRHPLSSSLPLVISELLEEAHLSEIVRRLRDPEPDWNLHGALDSQSEPSLQGGSGLDETLRFHVTGEVAARSIDHAPRFKDTHRPSDLSASLSDDAIHRLTNPESLAQLVRRRGSDSAWLEWLVRSLDEEKLVGLIHALEPVHAAAIVSLVLDIYGIHKEEPVAGETQDRFRHLLWLTTFTWLVTDHGSEFNRKVFLADVLKRLSERVGISFEEVLDTLGRGMHRASLKSPPRSPLASILALLLRDTGTTALVSKREAEFRGRTTHLESVLAQIKSAMRAASDAELLVFVISSVRQMSNADRRRLLSILLPTIDIADSPFGEAFREAASGVADSSELYSRVIYAVLKGRDIDLTVPTDGPFPASAEGIPGSRATDRQPAGEIDQRLLERVRSLLNKLVAERRGSRRARSRRISELGQLFEELRPTTVESWDIETLELAIRVRLALPPSLDAEPTAAKLMVVLLGRKSPDTKRFLASTLVGREGSRSMAVVLRSAYFPQLLILLSGTQGVAVTRLLAALEALPNSQRPSSDRIRTIFLREALASGGQLVQRILGALLLSAPQGIVRQGMVHALSGEEDALREWIAADVAGWSRDEGTASDASRNLEEILDHIGASGSEPLDEASIAELESHLSEGTTHSHYLLKAYLADPRRLERIVHLLPQRTWALLLRLLEPSRYRALLEAEEVLAQSWEAVGGGARSSDSRGSIRRILLDLHLKRSASVERFVLRVVELFQRTGSADRQSDAAFRDRAVCLADAKGAAVLRQALRSASPSEHPREASNSAPSVSEPSGEEDPIYIDNAGLVLVSPFLPHLFTTLGMLIRTDKGRSRWLDDASASRAVHLLQYLVDGRTSAPEPTLTLNKILCGLPLHAPIEQSIDLTPSERDMCAQLLQAMLDNWTILSGSSVAALQETFLAREGKLTLDEGRRKLQVQRKTLDVLVDQVPWSFGMIHHDWMDLPLFVTW